GRPDAVRLRVRGRDARGGARRGAGPAGAPGPTSRRRWGAPRRLAPPPRWAVQIVQPRGDSAWTAPRPDAAVTVSDDNRGAHATLYASAAPYHPLAHGSATLDGPGPRRRERAGSLQRRGATRRRIGRHGRHAQPVSARPPVATRRAPPAGRARRLGARAVLDARSSVPPRLVARPGAASGRRHRNRLPRGAARHGTALVRAAADGARGRAAPVPRPLYHPAGH